MKKKRLVSLLAVMALSVFCLSLFAACGLFGGDDSDKDDTPKEYTIQYTDDAGLHTLTVTENMLYSIETIPEKKGYKFLGLFDAQEGGKQYVLANGTAVNAFTDGKNIVLYPQFKADEYTVILDYQDAQVTGERQFTVEYASSLPVLPKDLTVAHKKFVGWFTAQNCQGTKVADQYGLIPVVSTLNEENFDLSQDIIYLYAGFEVEKYTVTCYFGGGIDSEEMQVEYNTPVSQVVPDTRVDGKAPIVWSQTQGGEPFAGKITSDTALYALEYAPVIELDVNGGDKLIPLVARAGTSITLPTPTNAVANFMYWEDVNGNKYTNTTMPTTSITLKAVWKAKIAFDENGGTNVNDISESAGSTITLPVPEREGYIFVGWYNTKNELYTSTKMPSTGILLKAGWYKAKNVIITVIDNNTSNKVTVDNKSFSINNRKKIDLVEYLPNIPSDGVKINYKISFKWGCVYQERSATGTIALYEGAELNSSYQLASKSLSHTSDHTSYISDSLSGVSVIKSNVLYLYYSGSGSGSWGSTSDVAYFDVSINLTYPDTSKLYL